MQTLLPGLDADQTAVVRAPHDHTPLDVVAGAGAGKTRALVARARLLARGLVVWRSSAPSRVVVVTFTVDAAEELRERLEAAGETEVWAGTIHSFAAQLLNGIRRYAGRSIIDPDDGAELLTEARVSVGQRGARGLYERWLAESHSVDYDGLITDARKALVDIPDTLLPLAVLVDEAQDLDSAQHDLLDALVAKGVHVTRAGDPRQSIYRFRGAVPDRWLLPSGAPPLVIETNYRSSPEVIDHANQLTVARPWRPMLASRTTPGVVLYDTRGGSALVDALVEAGGRPGAAVLCRSWSDVGVVTATLRELEIPATIPASNSDGRWTRLLSRWLRYVASRGRDTNLSWLVARAMYHRRPNATRRGNSQRLPIGDLTPTTLVSDALEELMRLLREVSEEGMAAVVATSGLAVNAPKRQTVAQFANWWSFGRRSERSSVGVSTPGSVEVSTIHGAKGREWDHVVVVGARWSSLDAEEASICYVAATRARRTLVVL